MKILALALAASLFCFSSVHAATISGTVSFGNPLNSAEPGLVLKADSMDPNAGAFTSASFSQDLNPGDSFTFDAFVLYTEEETVEDDDKKTQVFSLLFDIAGFGLAELFGEAVGNVWDLGFTSIHDVGVSYPVAVVLNLGNGETLKISSPYFTIFNIGYGSLTPGRNSGFVNTFVLELVAAPVAAVPLPATLPLALGAFGLLAVASRRRKARVV